MVLGRKKRSPGRFNYTDQIPGYDAGDNPLGDIAPRPRPPQDTPPQDPPAQIPPDYQDPGLGGGGGSGSSPGVGPGNDFMPHPMYNPETGEMVMANTYQEHLNLSALGYIHERPGGNGAESGNDYALIGVISLLFFGGLILGLRK